MKQFILITTLLFLSSFYFKAFGQVNQFPYLESFENETFTEGTNVYFITNWFGNFVDGIRIYPESQNVKSGATALGLWPIAEEGEDSEEIEITVNVDLDLTEMENCVVKFWVATQATAAYKHVKLYVKQSMDGGLTFGPKFIMGTDYRGFLNADTPYKEYIFPLHTNANNNSNVVLQFIAKSGARKGTVAKLLIDDVYIYSAPVDIFPPLAVEPKPLNVNEINIRFSESVDETTLVHDNFIFSPGSTSGHGGSGSGGHKMANLTELPTVGSITLNEPDMITLNLNTPIEIGKYYDLTISNIKDLAGNTIITTTSTIIYNPLTEGLIITEIMYDEPPKEQNDNLEFIEIYNVTNEPIELGGLMIKGGIASGKLPEFTLQPDSYWVTAKNTSAFYNFFGVIVHEWMGANLSNDEPESLYIVNTNHHSDVKIDSLTYRAGSPWPEGAAGLGYSMELIDPLADNSNPSNWKNSNNFFGTYNGYDIYATPGAPNSTLGLDNLLLEKAIRLYPNPVLDHLTIDSDIQLKKVEMYSMFGKKVKDINSGFKFISTHTLSHGMYIVKVYFENSFMYKKIIKN